MKSLIPEHDKQCTLHSNNFSMTLQTEILPIETSDFLNQLIILKSFNSVLNILLKSRSSLTLRNNFEPGPRCMFLLVFENGYLFCFRYFSFYGRKIIR